MGAACAEPKTTPGTLGGVKGSHFNCRMGPGWGGMAIGVLADLGIAVGFVTDIVEIRRWRCILSRARPLMAMRSSR